VAHFERLDANLPTWLTIQETADRAFDSHENIVQFVIEDRVPYRYHEDGIEIWWEGFQMLMTELYNIEEMLAQVDAVMQRIIDKHGPEKFSEIIDALMNPPDEPTTEADVHSLLTDYTRERDEPTS
jgi:hypothetical protein